MAGQMCWLPKMGTDGEKILHLRLYSYQPWKPYTTMPNLAMPEHPVPGMSTQTSKGWATCQRLSKAGWELIPTSEAYKSSKMAS